MFPPKLTHSMALLHENEANLGILTRRRRGFVVLAPIRSLRWLGAIAVVVRSFSATDLDTDESPAISSPTTRSGRGWSYNHVEKPEIPWSMHVVTVDRARHDLGFFSALGGGAAFGMATVPDQIKKLPPDLGLPIAAINGDYYHSQVTCPADPQDLQIRQGELVSGPEGHACFWITPDGLPQSTNVHSKFRVVLPDGTSLPFKLNEERLPDSAVLYSSAVGNSTHTREGVEWILKVMPGSPWLPLRTGQTLIARVRQMRTDGNSPIDFDTLVLSLGQRLATRVPTLSVGAELRIITETVPDLSGVQTAIGGGPTLIRDRKSMEWPGIQTRHPRTAIGWSATHFYLVVVDGRQSKLSLGMTLPELAEYMRTLGCDEAMNLDGGGSASLWVYGNVMSSPSEGRERPAANSLVLLQRKNSP
ncbi:MAG: phosphodiester glycosidase family protein [Pedosphaera sp.]|nr:phosphodiester glycosidase family protein [Pedosphaera sp.]